MPDPKATPVGADTEALLARLYRFCFPGGEATARLVRSVLTVQRGEMRMSPAARWIPFAAEEFTAATASNFHWDARLDPDKLTAPTVTDAYEKGHGRLVVKLAGLIPVQKVTGPEADKGELQRYLSSIMFCPPILLNHPFLLCSAVGPSTLRLQDQKGPTGAAVDVEIAENGQPLACRAQRPRMLGKETVLTPWSGQGSEFRESEGLRVATRLEVHWHLPGGAFTYYRSDITKFTAMR